MNKGDGYVHRVQGPLVEAAGLTAVAVSSLVRLGDRGVPGEVVGVREGVATVEAFEYTGGLRPGDPVTALGVPLSARLGPGLLGGVFDGLLRPLAHAPVWLEPGTVPDRQPTRRRAFVPGVGEGDVVGPGTELGVVRGAGVVHRVLVPPTASGRVEALRSEGPCGDDEVVAVVGGVDVPLTTRWPVRLARPVRERLPAGPPLVTGQRVVDQLFPIARGGSACVPGGFGTGKTVLLQQLAKWCDADVIVYVGCGERGNEMADVLHEFSALSDPRTGGRLLDRSVVIANTSNMPVTARESAVASALTVAEYYRDMGLHVVVIADSTSRWAEALREFSSRTGDLPAEEGYPASLSSALAALYERAARVVTLGGREGSVTLVGAVSPPGGDLTEPVTTLTQRFVRATWSLDRDLAYGRHYPAVSWTASYSRDVEVVAAWYAAAGDPTWAARRAAVAGLLTEADRLAALAELLGVTALPGHERMILLGGRLLREGLLQQSALSERDAASSPARSAALVTMLLDVVAECQALVGRGVPATTIEEADFSPVLRAREDAGADDIGEIGRRRQAVLDMLRSVGKTT
ncbi:MAG: V-type ATP synthase subunit A [Kineosporiaceae bacterium]